MKYQHANKKPEIASEFFSQKWNKPISGYQIINSIKKIFKEKPVVKCENEVKNAMNYSYTKLQRKSFSTD